MSKIASVALVNSGKQSYKGFFYIPIATQQYSTIVTCPGKLQILNVPLKTLILDRYHVYYECGQVFYSKSYSELILGCQFVFIVDITILDRTINIYFHP